MENWIEFLREEIIWNLNFGNGKLI
jgi:hypothetical protein